MKNNEVGKWEITFIPKTNKYYRDKGLRTAEAVLPGHPDKICDQISDAILDEYLKIDPESRVAVETMGGHGHIYITGEVTSKGMVDVKNIVQKVYSEIGYTDELEIHVNIVAQSPEIATGVDTGGAGDQGIMIGYACYENDEMVPQELYLARKILRELPKGYGPDGKSQVTLGDNGEIDTIVLSVQKKDCGAFGMMRSYNQLKEYVQSYQPRHSHIQIFKSGGFAADTGLTGRKLAVDNYGPQIPLGGGGFSGKDATKVDRSGAYMARRIAVDYLRKEKCHEVLVKLAYSIGVADPVMAVAIIDGKREVNLLETGEYDLTPRGIIDSLELDKPIYRDTAAAGHFGHRFPWDK